MLLWMLIIRSCRWGPRIRLLPRGCRLSFAWCLRQVPWGSMPTPSPAATPVCSVIVCSVEGGWGRSASPHGIDAGSVACADARRGRHQPPHGSMHVPPPARTFDFVLIAASPVFLLRRRGCAECGPRRRIRGGSQPKGSMYGPRPARIDVVVFMVRLLDVKGFRPRPVGRRGPAPVRRRTGFRVPRDSPLRWRGLRPRAPSW